MSALDLIMIVGLGIGLLVMVLQMTRATLHPVWLVLWFAVFCTWVLLSPWPLEVVNR